MKRLLFFIGMMGLLAGCLKSEPEKPKAPALDGPEILALIQKELNEQYGVKKALSAVNEAAVIDKEKREAKVGAKGSAENGLTMWKKLGEYASLEGPCKMGPGTVVQVSDKKANVYISSDMQKERMIEIPGEPSHETIRWTHEKEIKCPYSDTETFEVLNPSIKSQHDGKTFITYDLSKTGNYMVRVKVLTAGAGSECAVGAEGLVVVTPSCGGLDLPVTKWQQ